MIGRKYTFSTVSNYKDLMATFVETPSGTHKAVIRMHGWPTVSKTFRLKRDAKDWARRTEDEMVRGVYLSRVGSERMTVEAALNRYLAEVTPTKKPTTQRSEGITAKHLSATLGKYSMAAVTGELAASYRDQRIADGKANNTVRIELAMLSNLFTIAIQEWGLGLTYNPVTNIRKPSPGKGRDRRVSTGEELRLLATVGPYRTSSLVRRIVLRRSSMFLRNYLVSPVNFLCLKRLLKLVRPGVGVRHFLT